jgi:hypothetical protein
MGRDQNDAGQRHDRRPLWRRLHSSVAPAEAGPDPRTARGKATVPVSTLAGSSSVYSWTVKDTERVSSPRPSCTLTRSS